MVCKPKKKTASKKNFETILNSIHKGIIAVDKKGIIYYLNTKSEEILQVSDEEVLGKHISTFFPVISDKILEFIKREQYNINDIFIEKRTNIAANLAPIIEEGIIIGSLIVFQKISDFNKIVMNSDQYQKISRQFNAIMEVSFDGIFIADGQGKVINLNKRSAAFIEKRKEDLIGKTVSELLELGWIEAAVTPDVLKNKASVTKLQKLKSGKDILITGNPIIDDLGNIEFVIINERDITMLNTINRQLQESEKLSQKYFSELQHMRKAEISNSDIVAVDKNTKKTFEMARVAAKFDTTILITGESGVGKSLIANFIHKQSDRVEGPMVNINCGTIPETLVESELFGYEKGAFTGADTAGKPGLIELADSGTLFLDEIGELTPNIQVKLLKVLEDKEITPVGGLKSKKVDVRIIAATNRDLEELIVEKKFREDLFYRINIVPIRIKPLRERRDDIPTLIYYFLRKLNEKFGCNKSLSQNAFDILSAYSFPGNVRELENLIERLIVLCPKDKIQSHDLPQKNLTGLLSKKPYDLIKKGLTLHEALESFEREIIMTALKKFGSRAKAARALGVNSSTIVRKAKKYMIKTGSAVLH